MDFEYSCPECKQDLFYDDNRFYCNNCNSTYTLNDNHVIFENQFTKNLPVNKLIKDLLIELKHNEFETAIDHFLILHNEYKSQLKNTDYDKSADVIFHGIGKNFSRCLNIKSDFGNKSEILSHIFNQVYAVEFDDDCIEFQKNRFKERKCNNISITKCNLLKLPFPDNFFDLILCNGILDNINFLFQTKNISKIQNQLIQELKRVINTNGCIIFGVNNNNGFKIKFQGSNESLINDTKVSSKQNFSDYSSILQNNDLKIKSYWAFPSYQIPYYSGELNDEISLKAFFKNLSMFASAFKGGQRQGKIKNILLSIFTNLNYPFVKNLVEIFSPSFIFCCWKNNQINSFENWIKEETGYDNVLRMSRHGKNLFMLLNVRGEIEKAVYVKRYGDKIPNQIKLFDRKFPNVKDPSERIWMVNWLKGRPVNPKNNNEIILTINWLIEFQKKNKLTRMTRNDIIAEITFIKNGLKYFGHKNTEKYFKWLNEYEKYLQQNSIHMTPIHGDFWCTNILYENETKKIDVIDWESSSELGNPYGDFIWFLSNLLGMSSKDPILKFKKNLSGKGEMSEIFEQVKFKINSHFGFKLDFILLLRINLMKWMIIQEQIKEKTNTKLTKPEQNQSTFHIKILDAMSEFQ